MRQLNNTEMTAAIGNWTPARDPDRRGEEDVDGVLAVVERHSEPHGGDDAGETEGQRQRILHQDDDPGDEGGQQDQGLDDRLLKAALLSGEGVDPGHRIANNTAPTIAAPTISATLSSQSAPVACS